jgi:catechol 2,3-dioxygenase-like lactoylglutathione lyase family enzyme
MQPLRILETAIYARDLEAARRFYQDVFGLVLITRDPGRHVFFRCGASVLLIFDPAATSVPSRAGGSVVPAHGTHGPGHFALATREADLPAWRERLAQHGVDIEAEVVWPGGGRSLYVRDPAGNSVELASPTIWGLPEPGGEA